MKKSFFKNFKMINVFVGTGLTTYGLLTYNKFKKEKILKDPIIQEFLRIIENDEKIRKTVGLPISIKNGIIDSVFISNNKDGNFADIHLPIKGKLGSFNVKIYGNSIKQKEIENSQKKNYYQKEYYIPELKILERIENLQNKNKESQDKNNIDFEKEKLNEDDIFWRIEMIEMTKKTGLRTNISKSVKIPEILYSKNNKNFTRKTLKDIINYENERKSYFQSLIFFDSHIDFKYKKKMEKSYKKRFFIINTFMVVGFLFYVWFVVQGKKGKFQTLAHSEVIKKSQNLVENYLRKIGMGKVNFDETIMGGLYSGTGDCSFLFNGKNFHGKAFFKVDYDKINFELNESRIEYYLRNKNGEEEFFNKSL